MNESLIVCSGCSRHVRAAETVCPFCAAAVVALEGPSGAAHWRRAGTATLLAIAAAATLAACYGGPTPPSDSGPDQGTDVTEGDA
jgi:hypothetical protein